MVKRWIAVGVTLLAFLVVGCGVPQEDYDAVVADTEAAWVFAASLQSQLGEVESDLAAAETDLSAVRSELAKAQDDIETAQDEAAADESKASSAQGQVSSVQRDVAAAEARIAELEAAITAAVKAEEEAKLTESLKELRVGYPELFRELLKLPELEEIDARDDEAIEDIAELAESGDPEVQQGLRLILEYGIPTQNGSKYMPVYPVPDYNTQMQVLFWLALNKDIDEDYDRIAIALALDYGTVVTYGDDQVDEAVKQYICQVYDHVAETDQFLREKNLDWQAKDYPLEADMLLVWGACGMRYPTFYDQVGQTGKTPWTHFWYIEFAERPMNIEDFNWLFVSVEVLKEMRDWTVQKGFAVNDVGKVANNIDSYAGERLHYYTDKPDVPPSYVEVEGRITPGCRLSNPDWQWKSLKEKNEFLGNCEDTLYVGCMLLKSLNIGAGTGSVKAEGLAHGVILYYAVGDDVLRTTSNQLGTIERRAKGEIVYRYYQIPWDNLHHRDNSMVITESSDKKVLEKGVSTEWVLKWR